GFVDRRVLHAAAHCERCEQRYPPDAHLKLRKPWTPSRRAASANVEPTLSSARFPLKRRDVRLTFTARVRVKPSRIFARWAQARGTVARVVAMQISRSRLRRLTSCAASADHDSSHSLE